MEDEPNAENEDVHSSRIEDCESMRMASLRIFTDYIQTSLRRAKLGWRKKKPSHKQGIRLNVYVTMRLTAMAPAFEIS